MSELLGCLAFFAAVALLTLISEGIKRFCRAGSARVARYEARVSKSGKVE